MSTISALLVCGGVCLDVSPDAGLVSSLDLTLTITPVLLSAGLCMCLLGTRAQPHCCRMGKPGTVAAMPLSSCQIWQLRSVPMHCPCHGSSGTPQNTPVLPVPLHCQFTCSGWFTDLVLSLSSLHPIQSKPNNVWGKKGYYQAENNLPMSIYSGVESFPYASQLLYGKTSYMLRNPRNNSQHTYHESRAPLSCRANLSLFSF